MNKQEVKKLTVLIDNGHGIETPGKRSPDSTLREYAWTRKAAILLEKELNKIGISAIRVTPEENDVPISMRIRRVNEQVNKSKDNTILISLHNNAAGNGNVWLNARGFSVHVAQNASTNSRKLANLIFEEANKLRLKVRPYSPSQPYWVQNLGICRETKCPAVLTESLFMDNKEDVKYLLTEEGINTLVKAHINGIKKYFGM